MSLQDQIYTDQETTFLRNTGGIGRRIPETMTAEQAFYEMGLDLPTAVIPITGTMPITDEAVPLPQHRAHVCVRTGNVHGIVSQHYNPVENIELAKMADEIASASEGQAKLIAAGSANDGRRVFAQLLMEPFEVTDGDVVEPYLLGVNTHGGKGAQSFNLSTNRIYCTNQLEALGKASQVRFIHVGPRSEIKDRVATARLIFQRGIKDTEKIKKQLRKLAECGLTYPDQIAALERIFLKTYKAPATDASARTREEYELQKQSILERWKVLLFEHEHQANCRNTAWGLLNAVTQYHDHERGRGLPVGQSDARVTSNLFGASAAAKKIAFKEVLQLV